MSMSIYCPTKNGGGRSECRGDFTSQQAERASRSLPPPELATNFDTRKIDKTETGRLFIVPDAKSSAASALTVFNLQVSN